MIQPCRVSKFAVGVILASADCPNTENLTESYGRQAFSSKNVVKCCTGTARALLEMLANVSFSPGLRRKSVAFPGTQCVSVLARSCRILALTLSKPSLERCILKRGWSPTKMFWELARNQASCPDLSPWEEVAPFFWLRLGDRCQREAKLARLRISADWHVIWANGMALPAMERVGATPAAWRPEDWLRSFASLRMTEGRLLTWSGQRL